MKNILTVLFAFAVIFNANADGNDKANTTRLNSIASDSQEHEYVDLGLSVCWGTCNLGASSPQEYGNYYAWGDTEPMNASNENYYKHGYQGGTRIFTKYCNDSKYGHDGFTDNKVILDPEDDAATASLGDNWRMPTYEEFNELKKHCTWTWTSVSGTNGFQVTGANGNSIFLPASGTYPLVDDDGAYWTSSLYTDNAYYAYHLYFNHYNSVYLDGFPRWNGCTIRAVHINVENPDTTDISDDPVTPGNTVAGHDIYLWKGGIPTTYESVDSVTFKDLMTEDDENGSSSNASNAEYVDLGLSVDWATCNLGASSPEDYGDYYAWGETEPKDEYSWDNYKYCKGSYTTLTKYCRWSGYGYNGFFDFYKELVDEDDAATVIYGSPWRTPSLDEMKELIDSCTWNWTAKDGVNGCEVIGPNGNSIFLPASGVKPETTLGHPGAQGYYWSSTLNSSNSPTAYYMHLSSDNQGTGFGYRSSGSTIRPVRDKGNEEENKSMIAYVWKDGTATEFADIDSLTFAIHTIDTIPDNPQPGNDTIPDNPEPKDDYEMVDLGLSVMWATYNVGATKPGETGDYFRWGEPEPMSFPVGNMGADMDSVPIRISGTKYDAAYAERGGLWHTPTIEEMEELTTKCQFKWSYADGHYGMKVTGPNGNSIFLPASGYYDGRVGDEDGILSNGDLIGRYMTGNDFYPGMEPFLELDDVKDSIIYDSNSSVSNIGMSVRPVYGKLTGRVTPRKERDNLRSISLGEGLDWDDCKWAHHENWGSAQLPETWYGVTVNDNGNITELNLDDNNIIGNDESGTSLDISRLPYLKKLSVSRNPNLGGLMIANTRIDSLIIDSCFSPVSFSGSSFLSVDSVHYVSLSNYDPAFSVGAYTGSYAPDNVGIYDNLIFNGGEMHDTFNGSVIKNLTLNSVTYKTDFKPGNLKSLTINNSTIEQDEGSSATHWQAYVSERFECHNSTIDDIIRQTDFADGCEIVFDNATIRISRNTVKTLNCTFTQSTENWIKYVVE